MIFLDVRNGTIYTKYDSCWDQFSKSKLQWIFAFYFCKRSQSKYIPSPKKIISPLHNIMKDWITTNKN